MCTRLANPTRGSWMSQFSLSQVWTQATTKSIDTNTPHIIYRRYHLVVVCGMSSTSFTIASSHLSWQRQGTCLSSGWRSKELRSHDDDAAAAWHAWWRTLLGWRSKSQQQGHELTLHHWHTPTTLHLFASPIIPMLSTLGHWIMNLIIKEVPCGLFYNVLVKVF